MATLDGSRMEVANSFKKKIISIGGIENQIMEKGEEGRATGKDGSLFLNTSHFLLFYVEYNIMTE